MADDSDLMDLVDDFMVELATAGSRPAALPAVHDTDDLWTKPTGPCMVCGQVRWRVWSDDGGASWPWICNGCRLLVVINPDGTRWRA